MAIVHIVTFEFKSKATDEQIAEVCKNMLALKDKCLDPSTQKPYLKSGIGGINNSPEGQSGGSTHVFVSEFENEADRKYYLEQDPVHLAFVKSLGDIMERVRVVDFTPGVF
ncbi:hypothetical protein K402DRAFT_391219 [Aulographum hederae CBS 113979]|uniref:Stress-response A/B barrel domain-containing protein n=1 Tax=Aulographum hederae CBS 113979 TaxID=1176131 RepID=A0A6G1H768_9PEZI|nr:hypothetical protein K402DRAFT_391219 [Aulographum hederae CBS 113979]